MSDRIGIVTGGGDCPGLNAVIRAVAKAAAKRGWETIGFLGGYEGILEPQRYVELDYQKLGPLLTRGGTILGTANRGRFSAKVGHGETRRLPQELIDGVKAGMQEAGHPRPGQHRRRRLAEHRPAVVRGRRSPGGRAQDHRQRPRRHRDDLRFRLGRGLRHRRLGPSAHHGRKPQPRDGAGGHGPLRGLDRPLRGRRRRRRRDSDPGDPVHLRQHLRQDSGTRESGEALHPDHRGRRRREAGGEFVTAADQDANREARLGGIGAVVAAEIEKRTGKEARVCVLGHLQRGGSPTNFDRALCSIFGAEAVELIAAGKFGYMVAYQGSHAAAVKITEAVGRLKTVPPDGGLARTARALGICFGD